MDPSESPFSNLDVWCDWNGDFNAPVEVTVSVEVSKDESESTVDDNNSDLNTLIRSGARPTRNFLS